VFIISYGPIKHAINSKLGASNFKPLDEQLNDTYNLIEAVDATGGTTTTGGANAKLNNILQKMDDFTDLFIMSYFFPSIDLGSIPIGSIVLDYGSNFEGHQLSWRIAAKNHPGYPLDSVTLITTHCIGRTQFSSSLEGVNNQYPGSILANYFSLDFPRDFISNKMRNNLLGTQIPIFRLNNTSGTMSARVFAPSRTEMNLGAEGSVTEGFPFPIFTDNTSRIVNALGNAEGWYLLRTPVQGNTINVRYVGASDGIMWPVNMTTPLAFRPVCNLPASMEIVEDPTTPGRYLISSL